MFEGHDVSREQSRWLVVLCVSVATVGGALVGVSPASAEVADEYRFGYVGLTQQVTVPDGVESIAITARGGGGGAEGGHSDGTVGAETSGVLNVQRGDVIRFGVGGTGQEARDDGKASKGGWGGLGASGGKGAWTEEASAAGGGGATTVQLIRAGEETTMMVAGGGGGDGGEGYDDAWGGSGGHGGDNATRLSASGSDGRDGASNPGSGGKADHKESGAGENGVDQKKFTPGGGGGGGVKGGDRGKNIAEDDVGNGGGGGGGGGAGSTMIDESVDSPMIKPAEKQNRAKNGEVIIAWV